MIMSIDVFLAILVNDNIYLRSCVLFFSEIALWQAMCLFPEVSEIEFIYLHVVEEGTRP
jgi:hypothetical protein